MHVPKVSYCSLEFYLITVHLLCLSLVIADPSEKFNNSSRMPSLYGANRFHPSPSCQLLSIHID